jgi:murein DD-endopeptidase MepM/ murein hydrolase activator NlpD
MLFLIGLGAPFIAPVSADRLPPTPSVERLEFAQARYRPPLSGRIIVLRRFEPPPTPYSAGHRGVDLGATSGAPVVAAAAGRVSFAGQVAGRGVVVIAHRDGIRTEYEPVLPLVSAGEIVTPGQPIGRLHGTHDQQPPDRCLHWGARRGDAYIDPLLLLAPLGPVRLLPWSKEVRAGPPGTVRGAI